MGEEIPLERGHQLKKGTSPIEIVILPLLGHLAWKRLQIDTDLLRIITSTADELSGGTNIDDLERPWIPKIWVLSDFCYFRLRRTLRVNFCWNILEIYQDNLRTKWNTLWRVSWALAQISCYDNFGKCGPILTILSLLHFVINYIEKEETNVATSPHICCHTTLWKFDVYL